MSTQKNDQKVSILHIIETIGRGGGAETLLANTVTNLPEYNNIVVTLYPYHTEYDLGLIPVQCLRVNSWWSFIKAVIQLRGIIKKNKVRLIHAHLYRSALLAKLAKPRKVRLAVSLHSLLTYDLFEKSRWALCVEKLLMHQQDAIIAVSQTVLNDYLQCIRFKKKGFVLYNFVPDIFFANIINGNSKNEKINCMAVGHFKRAKNYPYLIASFRNLDPEYIHIDIFGAGPLENEMRVLIQRYNLSSVTITGLSDNISELFKRYNIFISVSEYEGFGIALVEAMAAGLVCIVSDIPVYREIAADACLFIDIGNTDSLNKLLSQILNHQIYLGDLPVRARKRAFEISNEEKYFRDLKKIYEEVIA